MRVVALGPIHGYAIAQRIQQISRDELTARGRAQLKTETENWKRLTGVVGLVLKGTLEGVS
jgi:PadR family transcriptional regulator, regulatory protein PadR